MRSTGSLVSLLMRLGRSFCGGSDRDRNSEANSGSRPVGLTRVGARPVPAEAYRACSCTRRKPALWCGDAGRPDRVKPLRAPRIVCVVTWKDGRMTEKIAYIAVVPLVALVSTASVVSAQGAGRDGIRIMVLSWQSSGTSKGNSDRALLPLRAQSWLTRPDVLTLRCVDRVSAGAAGWFTRRT